MVLGWGVCAGRGFVIVILFFLEEIAKVKMN